MRKPFLWFRGLGLNFSPLTPQMRKPCSRCQSVIRGEYRFEVDIGSGRNKVNRVLCPACTEVYLEAFSRELQRAIRFVSEGTPIREARDFFHREPRRSS